jgi:N-acetylglucosaminyldiphosphoundecaprenol N-acetyl-beta-D-mannosaminyltransferase
MIEKVDYCGLPVTRLTVRELMQNIRRAVDQRTTLIASYMHLHTVNLMSNNPGVRDALTRFDIVIPDGIAVLWSSRLFGTSFRRDTMVTTYEVVMPVLVGEAIREKWSFFMFGGAPNIAARAMENLVRAFPGVGVAGTHHGYIRSDQEMDAVVRLIGRLRPTILLVGLGQPKQEEWILRYRDQLGASVILAVGSYFDKLARSVSLYPGWVKRTGLYWLYRLLTERGRVWRRYSIEVPIFAWNILRVRLTTHARSLDGIK